MKTVSQFDIEKICKDIERKLDGLELEEGNAPHRLTQDDPKFYYGYEIKFCIFDQELYLENVEISDDNGEKMYLEYPMYRQIQMVLERYVKNYYKN